MNEWAELNEGAETVKGAQSDGFRGRGMRVQGHASG